MTNRRPLPRWQPIKLLKLTNFQHVKIFAQEMNLGRQNAYSIYKARKILGVWELYAPNTTHSGVARVSYLECL
jgi:hypothetical protein